MGYNFIMSRKKTKNKYNKLFLKYRYLAAELKDAQEIFNDAKSLFIDAANKYMGNNIDDVVKDNFISDQSGASFYQTERVTNGL